MVTYGRPLTFHPSDACPQRVLASPNLIWFQVPRRVLGQLKNTLLLSSSCRGASSWVSRGPGRVGRHGGLPSRFLSSRGFWTRLGSMKSRGQLPTGAFRPAAHHPHPSHKALRKTRRMVFRWQEAFRMPPSRAAGFAPHSRTLCLPVSRRWHRSTCHSCPSQTQQLPTGLGLPALSLKLLCEWHLLVAAKTP